MFEPTLAAKFKKLVGTDLKSIDQAKIDLEGFIRDQTIECLIGIADDLKKVNDAQKNNKWIKWTADIVNDELICRELAESIAEVKKFAANL